MFTSFIIFNFAICKNSEDWPKRVLITNDNGIKDIKIIELAKAFSKIAKTYVVAPLEDQSGTSSYLGATRSGKIEVERIEISNDIEAYAVDGYPAAAFARPGSNNGDHPTSEPDTAEMDPARNCHRGGNRILCQCLCTFWDH